MSVNSRKSASAWSSGNEELNRNRGEKAKFEKSIRVKIVTYHGISLEQGFKCLREDNLLGPGLSLTVGPDIINKGEREQHLEAMHPSRTSFSKSKH